MLLVLIHFSLEKVFVGFSFVNSSCCVIFEFNKFEYVGSNVIRDKDA